MKAKHILKCAIALLMVIGLSSVVLFSNNKANAAATTSTITDYSGKVLFVPNNAVQYLNFYTATSGVSCNLATMSIYAHYPYTADFSTSVYIYNYSSNTYLNGLRYTGGGGFNYLTYSNGSYHSNSWVYSSTIPTLYMVLEFNNLSSLSSYSSSFVVPSLSTLYANGVIELESGPNSTDNHNFYAFLGGYWSNIDSETSYQKALDDVANDPNKYGYYTLSQLNDAQQTAYNQGRLSVSNNEMTFSSVMAIVFDGAADLLNTPVLGNLTIMHIISIPLILGVLLIILKLIRG